MEELFAMCQQQHPRLVGMLGLYCGDHDVAEDLAQEALIRLCRDWRSVRKLDAPERWLHRVAINLAHSHYRRKGIERRALSLLGSRRRQEPQPHGDVETLALLGNLPHRQKAALVLHYYLDMTVPEVAQVMEIPEGTAKTLIHRGARALRADPGVVEVRNEG
jgi:RNA polymerase sigma-70 factor (ECF subfamily)